MVVVGVQLRTPHVVGEGVKVGTADAVHVNKVTTTLSGRAPAVFENVTLVGRTQHSWAGTDAVIT